MWFHCAERRWVGLIMQMAQPGDGFIRSFKWMFCCAVLSIKRQVLFLVWGPLTPNSSLYLILSAAIARHFGQPKPLKILRCFCHSQQVLAFTWLGATLTAFSPSVSRHLTLVAQPSHPLEDHPQESPKTSVMGGIRCVLVTLVATKWDSGTFVYCFTSACLHCNLALVLQRSPIQL